MGKQRKLSSIWVTFPSMFWCFLLLSISFALVVFGMPNNNAVPISNERSYQLYEGWTLEGENRGIELPSVVEGQPNEPIIIWRQLPINFMDMGDSLCFFTSNQAVRVKVDGQVIYEYGQNSDAYFDVQPPPAWHIIPLAADMAGKTLSISYQSSFQIYTGVLNCVQLGSRYAHVINHVSDRLLSLGICFTIFIFGIFAILVYLFAHNRIAELNKLLYLGVTSILIAIWSACETKVMQIVTGNVYFIMVITFSSIMLAPIGMLLFFREGFRGRIRQIYNFFLAAFGLYFASMMLVQCFSLTSVYYFFPTFLVLLGFALILIFGSAIAAYLKHPCPRTRIPVLAVFFLLVFSFIELYRFVFQGLAISSTADTTLFSRIGIMLMIVTLGYSSIRQIIIYQSESTKAEAYKMLSETDSLSGLKNRTYLSALYPAIFRGTAQEQRWFSVIMVDIDNFKGYNDHYGHLAGDSVIRAVAHVLSTAIDSPLSCAIRYGGEEFLILLPDLDPMSAMQKAEQMKQAVLTLQIPHAYSSVSSVITVSQGVYGAIPMEQDCIEQLIDLADQALYEAKRKGKNCYFLYEGSIACPSYGTASG